MNFIHVHAAAIRYLTADVQAEEIIQFFSVHPKIEVIYFSKDTKILRAIMKHEGPVWISYKNHNEK